MNKEELRELEIKTKRQVAFVLLGVGITGFIGIFLFAIFSNRETTKEVEEPEYYPEQEFVQVEEDDWRYPTQQMGVQGRFWEYKVVGKLMDYHERQDVIDSGLLSLWPEFTETDVMWITGHNPGTMTFVAEEVEVGEVVELTTPSLYKGRYPSDTPDTLRYEIVEILETDIYAEDYFETLGQAAVDVYNNGVGEPWLVLQHSGEIEDSAILYLGRFIEKEEGEFVSNVIEDEEVETPTHDENGEPLPEVVGWLTEEEWNASWDKEEETSGENDEF